MCGTGKREEKRRGGLEVDRQVLLWIHTRFEFSVFFSFWEVSCNFSLLECCASSCRLRRSNEQIASGGLIGHGISPPHIWMYVSSPRVPDVFRDGGSRSFALCDRNWSSKNSLNYQPFFFYSWHDV